MIKTLLKKQIKEMGAFLYANNKNGTRRSKKRLVLYSFLMVYAFGVIGWLFYMIADSLCLPLIESGMGWLYFSLMGISATALGVFGSIFSTYSGLYQAKDNELLLSMPITPSKILFVRVLAIYLASFLFEAVVMIPAILVYQKYAAATLFSILLLFILPILALALSCILGWLTAIVISRLKRKNLITVILSLGFLAAYYFLIAQANYYVQLIVTNSEALGSSIKAYIYPFYRLGLAFEGDLLSMLIFTAIVAVLFGIVYYVLSRSFLKLATTKRGAAKTKYKEKTTRAATIDQALLRKEFSRLTRSSAYMLNCCMGTVFFLAAAVFIVIKGDLIRQFSSMLSAGDISLLACAGIALLASMNTLTAPSISLEGKTLWLIQSLPAPLWKALKAKLNLHMLLTAIPALICAVVLDIVLAPSILFMILIPLFSLIYILFQAALGLLLNLKFPNLSWTSENVAVKQSGSVMIAILGSWGSIVVLGCGYLFSGISANIYLLICTAVIGIIVVALLYLLKTKGTKMLAAL